MVMMVVGDAESRSCDTSIIHSFIWGGLLLHLASVHYAIVEEYHNIWNKLKLQSIANTWLS